jgi:Cofactor assembly of complex C subunit B, CCB2/CCB4
MAVKKDRDAVLRLLPFGVGGIAGSFLLVNRLVTEGLTPAQSRSDVVGVILCAVMILIGLLWQRVQPKTPDAVILVGKEGLEISPDLPEVVKIELAWASHLLLTNTATRSLSLYVSGQTILRRGILADDGKVVPGPIVQRVIQTQKPVYLVNVKIYPGKIEFNYLPANVQGIICQPVGKDGVLILAANAPRSYTQQDEAWIAGIAEKLAYTLNSDLELEGISSNSET